MTGFLPPEESWLEAAGKILAKPWEQGSLDLEGCILSASGWRRVFARNGDEESRDWELDIPGYSLAALMAKIFAESAFPTRKARIAVACDSRPTGPLMAHGVIGACLASGHLPRWCGSITAPQVMAWARLDPELDGFIYISASHNPIGHNGMKFGLKTGGVLSGPEVKPLIESLKIQSRKADTAETLRTALRSVPRDSIRQCLSSLGQNVQSSEKAYWANTMEVLASSPLPSVQSNALSRITRALGGHKTGILADLNGSARCTALDARFLRGLGADFRAINDTLGLIAHRIVPEGESLDPCRLGLETLWQQEPHFVLGYMPDNDGDRGNLVYMRKKEKKAFILEAQEVYALACLSELANAVLDHDRTKGPLKLATVVNDPTSMRIEDIADKLGARVFRAEVGEANVVQLAEEKRAQGWTVPILGEGSNGGSIVYPSKVRDPLNTVLGILRLLGSRDSEKSPFGLWCKACGIPFDPGFGLEDIVDSLPAWTTSSAYEDRALLRIRTMDHRLLKSRYEALFLAEWEQKKSWLASRFGITSWVCQNHEGTVMREGTGNRTGEERGGFKILFRDANGKDKACLWMRGSGTEPVFRILVDLEGHDPEGENLLLTWHSEMVKKADGD